jgi:glycosyltransferase involved in cell wall biosynthesis
MSKMIVSLIIPAYNEEETIGEVIRDTSEIMELYGLQYEIIVVNDCSTDDTERVALFTQKAIVFTNETNRGKGYCLRRALKQAHGDIIVTLDADGEHKPKEIPELLNALFEGNDIVAGSRFLNNQVDITSRINRLGNFFFNMTITTLTGRRITDSQTGFRAIKREIAEAFNLQSDGFEIESEFTIKSLRNGFRFKEVPITVERRKYNKSKIKIISDGTKILSTIIHSSLLQTE